MKKILGALLFILFLFPLGVKAEQYGIENFNMHVTVLENGDLYVKEAFSMNGTYNGMDRDLYFKNPNLNEFTGSKESFNGSDIYNGSDIELIQIRAIPFQNNISWEEMLNKGTKFTKSYSASSGEFGVYTESKNMNGVSYRIFNPSSERKFFYLEYIIKDMAISHQDIAEIGWNIFGENFRESIHYLNIDIYIPNNKETLRAWAHGPLIGDIKLDGKNHINLTLEGLHANTAIDTRFVFDKNLLTNPKKTTQINALNTIIELETEKAEQANLEREEARKQIAAEKRKKTIITILLGILGTIWIVGLGFLIRYVYKKHDKEYESTFKTKYFRDFPADYNPSTVGYLFRQNVNNNDLSACLLNLIYKKVIVFEKIDKKDYKLTYHENSAVLTPSDQKLIQLIFRDNNQEITLNRLKSKAKSGYSSFINDFTSWKTQATIEAKEENFYEQKNGIKAKASLYSFLGIGIGILSFQYSMIIAMICFVAGLISLFYFMSFTKKTPKGNEHYLKWKALKKFMEDFGQIDKKDLPEIVLWEKYLVYAVSLGCADKLAKTMEIRVNEFNEVDLINLNYNMHMMRDMMIFNHIISSSVNTAVNNAYSAQSIANSRNSSGGGFGGGFSGGGGSFGGGSGGGRF